LRLAFGSQTEDDDHDPIINSINIAQKAKQPRTGPGTSGTFRPGDRSSVTLWLDIGRDHGIRPGDIVGAIANEAKIPGRLIGSIELHDNFSYVNVPQRDARRVIEVLNHSTIRGHRIRANVASARKA